MVSCKPHLEKKNQNISEQKVADVIGKQQCYILHSESD